MFDKIYFLINNPVIEPLGVMQLIASLKKEGHDIGIIRIDKEDPFVILNEGNFILLYSVITGSHKYFANLNYRLKYLHGKGRLFSIFGGPHPTYFPQYINEQGIDAICRGEADESLPYLINQIKKGYYYDNSKSFWFKLDDGIIKNETYPLCQDLDKLPFADRELLYQNKSNRDNPIKNFMASLGCLYNCSYCFNCSFKQLYKGQKTLRWHSPEYLIDEILQVKKKYPLKLIFFQDDMFAFKPAWLNNFLSLYSQKINLPFHCQLRVESINKDTLQSLQQAGCSSVTFAIETANSFIRQKLLRRNMTNEQMVTTAKLCHKIGLKFRTENMIGLPGETKKDIYETLKLNIKCKPTLGWCSIYQPYPGTDLSRYTSSIGLIDKDIDQIKDNFFESTVLKFPKKHRRFINNIQKFFSTIVRYPWVLPIIKIIIKIPENRFFYRFSNWHRQKSYNKKLYSIKRRNNDIRI